MAVVMRLAAEQQIRTDAGTQDWTVSGFGTPDAAIIFGYKNGTADTNLADVVTSVGFTDGSASACAFASSDDGQVISSTPNCHVAGTYAQPWYLSERDAGTLKFRASSGASLITDGVRITFGANGDSAQRPSIRALLIKGVTGKVKVGHFTPSGTTSGTVNVTTTGINPNYVMIVCGGGTAINDAVGAYRFSVGAAVKDGSTPPAQFTAISARTNASDVAYGAQIVYNDRVAGYSETSSVQSTYRVSNFGTGQFTVETVAHVGSAVILGYIAIEFPVVPQLFMATAPTSSGNWRPATGTATPVGAFMLPTAAVDLATFSNGYSNGNRASRGLYVVTPQEEFCAFESKDTNETTSNNKTRHHNRLMVMNNSNSVIFSASQPTFDSTGLLYASANVTPSSEGNRIGGVYFYDTATTKYLKYLVQSTAVGAEVDGIVFNPGTGGAITGSKVGEFTGIEVVAGTGDDTGKGVLLVPAADFNGSGLAVDAEVVALARTSTFTTGIEPGVIVEE